MDWFGWQLSKDPAAGKSAAFGPQAILQELIPNPSNCDSLTIERSRCRGVNGEVA